MRRGPADSRGLSPAQRAAWERLYTSGPMRKLPPAFQRPFPPLVQAVEDGWLRPPGPILDVGCGIGTNAFWLASKGFSATGVDVAKAAIEVAESARGGKGRNPAFRVADVLVSPSPSSRFRSAIDVGCFQTLPPPLRADFAHAVRRFLSGGAPYLVFWVAREEQGAWGPPHRMSVGEVTGAFEPWFSVERIVHRPRTVRLTREVKRSSRPLATLAGYTALFVARGRNQLALM